MGREASGDHGGSFPVGHRPSRSRSTVAPDAVPEHEVQLVVRPLWEPALAISGADLRSVYVERYWLGVVGPSVIMLLRRLARGLEEHPQGFQISLADTARAIGLGAGTAKQSPINRTIDRACMFGAARRVSETEIHVRTHLPRLTARQLSRLPLAVRSAHQQWVLAESGADPTRPTAA